MPTINADRLLESLYELRQFGAVGTGVVRPAFSDEDMEARDWLKQQFDESGLSTHIDGVGNVFGESRNPAPAILLGSHADTQPTGGWLDGALGVMYGLEAARTLSEDQKTNNLAVDVVALQDEESRFIGCLGSRSLCGLLEENAVSSATDSDGISLEETLRRLGLLSVPRINLDVSRYVGFLEAHIEQGPHLEADKHHIGVVTSIVGLGGCRITFRGKQNHAGTTMMKHRKDAATALFALADAINKKLPDIAGPRTVWTMGRAVVQPGAPSIVPGYAELDLQYRDPSDEILDLIDEEIDELVVQISLQTNVSINIENIRPRVNPVTMDSVLRQHLCKSAARLAPDKFQEMPSGAYHDAGIMSTILPSAMLFIPSIGGVSHDFSENSFDDDIVVGCQVLVDAVVSILSDANS
ncbi:MAG: Zn-dependent hydrolase [Acidiferrobacteraceae bacterium]|nr:Zn-dependent hydrolase [Acidiferrobacteraceae bacterium]